MTNKKKTILQFLYFRHEMNRIFHGHRTLTGFEIDECLLSDREETRGASGFDSVTGC